MSNYIQEGAIAKLADGTTIDLTQAADTETSIYTCPSGKKCAVFGLLFYEFDEAVDEAAVTVGKTGGDCDEFLGDQTLTNVGASYADECLWLMPVPAATPAAALILDAGESLGVEITTAETTGSATCKAMPFGIEMDA